MDGLAYSDERLSRNVSSQYSASGQDTALGHGSRLSILSNTNTLWGGVVGQVEEREVLERSRCRWKRGSGSGGLQCVLDHVLL